MKLKRTHVLAATVAVAMVGTLAGVALGSTPSGFLGKDPVVTANLDHEVDLNSDGVEFETEGPTDVRVQKVVISPGGYSGWHHHPGIVIVAVKWGEVTFTNSDCSSKTYSLDPNNPNGSVFVEGGDDPGQASSVTGAKLIATFVAPDANPPVFRIEDDAPPCA